MSKDQTAVAIAYIVFIDVQDGDVRFISFTSSSAQIRYNKLKKFGP